MSRRIHDGSPPSVTSLNDSKLPVETLFTRALSAMTAVKISSPEHQTLLVTKRRLRKDRERSYSDGPLILPHLPLSSSEPDSDDSQLLCDSPGFSMISINSPFLTPIPSRSQSRKQSRPSSPTRSQSYSECIDKQEIELHSQLAVALRNRGYVSSTSIVMKHSSSFSVIASSSSRLEFYERLFQLISYSFM